MGILNGWDNNERMKASYELIFIISRSIRVPYVFTIATSETDGGMISDRHQRFAKGRDELTGIVAFVGDFGVRVDLTRRERKRMKVSTDVFYLFRFFSAFAFTLALFSIFIIIIIGVIVIAVIAVRSWQFSGCTRCKASSLERCQCSSPWEFNS